jgi:hypothetical protein
MASDVTPHQAANIFYGEEQKLKKMAGQYNSGDVLRLRTMPGGSVSRIIDFRGMSLWCILRRCCCLTLVRCLMNTELERIWKEAAVA